MSLFSDAYVKQADTVPKSVFLIKSLKDAQNPPYVPIDGIPRYNSPKHVNKAKFKERRFICFL